MEVIKQGDDGAGGEWARKTRGFSQGDCVWKKGRGDLVTEDRGLDAVAFLERVVEMATCKESREEEAEMVELPQDFGDHLAGQLCDRRHGCQSV
jgi:hypothetical protein